MSCLVASCIIVDVFWFWNWPFQSFFGGAPNPTTPDPDLGEIPPLLLSQTLQASCWYYWLKSSKDTMRKLELLMPLSFHIRVITCSWGTAQPESLLDSPGLQEPWNRPWAAWKQGMGEGISYQCMDGTCDPGKGQLAGISVGMLQKITAEWQKKGLERFLQWMKIET